MNIRERRNSVPPIPIGIETRPGSASGRYYDPLQRFFGRRIRRSNADASHAADLVQETFVVLLRGAGSLDLHTSFRSYLFGVAFRVLLAANRKDRAHAVREMPADLTTQPWAQTPIQEPEEALWVQQILSRMEATDSEILMLREYEQLAYGEIAELLCIPLNTVRSRLYRARIAFRSESETRPSLKRAEGDSLCR